MAVGSKHKCTVGDVEKLHNAEVRAVISELVSAAAQVIPLLPLHCLLSYHIDSMLSMTKRIIRISSFRSLIEDMMDKMASNTEKSNILDRLYFRIHIALSIQ